MHTELTTGELCVGRSTAELRVPTKKLKHFKERINWNLFWAKHKITNHLTGWLKCSLKQIKKYLKNSIFWFCGKNGNSISKWKSGISDSNECKQSCYWFTVLDAAPWNVRNYNQISIYLHSKSIMETINRKHKNRNMSFYWQTHKYIQNADGNVKAENLEMNLE